MRQKVNGEEYVKYYLKETTYAQRKGRREREREGGLIS